MQLHLCAFLPCNNSSQAKADSNKYGVRQKGHVVTCNAKIVLRKSLRDDAHLNNTFHWGRGSSSAVL